jgi:hypothetical protein
MIQNGSSGRIWYDMVQNGSLGRISRIWYNMTWGRIWYGIVQNGSLGRIRDGMIHRMVHWVEKYGMA